MSVRARRREGKTLPRRAPPELDQIGCQYVPHVQGMVKSQDLLIKNSDGANHNVNAQPTTNARFNMASPPNSEENKKFSKAEMAIPFKCDVHPWMSAYVHVMDHPFFAVTQQTARSSAVSAGRLRVSVRHAFGCRPDKPSQR
ncbi:MAG: hypothetical protein LC118_10585 [Dehalococcoidia bacterium]|nr:hypothetical protein [Dehalococcoidia bacterium]